MSLQHAVDISHGQSTFRIFGVSSEDHIYRQMANTGTFYEIDLLSYIEAIRDVLPPGVAVDVGANIGNHAVFLAEFVRPVVAFEPNPTVLPLLRRNVEGVDCRVVAKALGAAPDRGRVVVPDAGNVGTAQINTGSGDVEVSTLDAELAGERVAVMKVDVEGMELPVLAGAVDTITRCRPHLFLEAGTRQHFADLSAFLRPLGYEPVVRWAWTPVWHFAYQPSKSLIRRARWMRVKYALTHPGRKHPRY